MIRNSMPLLIQLFTISNNQRNHGGYQSKSPERNRYLIISVRSRSVKKKGRRGKDSFSVIMWTITHLLHIYLQLVYF